MAHMTARVVLLLSAPLLTLALPACAQEPETILDQKEWPVGGVGMGGDQYFTCAATDASHADDSLWLQVTELASQNVINEVSVEHPGDLQATAAILQIGGDRFVLAVNSSDRFSSAASDGSKIVAVMLTSATLTLQLEGVSAPKLYSYDLTEFPKAYATMVQHCGAPAKP